MASIDLGKSAELATKDVATDSKGKKHYPSLYISDVKGMDDLPDGEFTFTGKGKVVSMTDNKKAGTCTCEIEVLSIDVGEETGAAESLDKTLKKKESKKVVEEEVDMEDDSEETEE